MHLKLTNESIPKEIWIDESTMFECTYYRNSDGRNQVMAIRKFIPGSADNFDNFTKFFGGVKDLRIELFTTDKTSIVDVRGIMNSYVLNDKSQADGTVGPDLFERLEFIVGGYIDKGQVIIPKNW